MKFKQKKSKPILSDKIADALTVKPRLDIEDDHVFNTKPNTVSRVDFSSSDSEDEAAISDFKKRNVTLLSDISKKYEGQVVSRKDIEDNSDEDESLSDDDSNINGKRLSEKLEEEESASDTDNEEESDDYNITNVLKQMNASSDEQSDGSEKDDDDDDDEDEEGDEDDEDDEGEGFDISEMAEPLKEEFEHVKKQNVSEEAKKGTCVRNQLLLWEGLLEMRIHMQRCVSTANQMPMSETFNELKNNSEFAEETNKTVNNVSSLLDKFLTLQNTLLQKFPETKALSNKKQIPDGKSAKSNDNESDEEIPSDTDNEEIPSDTEPEDNDVDDKKDTPKIMNQKKRKLTDYDSDLALSHKAFKPFRDATIQKWNEKTRLATAANIKNTPTNTIMQQISFILSDKDKLIRRTQLKRSEYDIIGYTPKIPQSETNNQSDMNPVTRDRKDNDEYIPEIFDDSDFYHQLLRELIECKTADITDPVQLSRQWIALQQLRNKMKRKVDTKATKGRKIKYVVHNKLVSYMAPEKNLKWTDENCKELYSSLFGKIFENNNVGVNVNLDNLTTNKIL